MSSALYKKSVEGRKLKTPSVKNKKLKTERMMFAQKVIEKYQDESKSVRRKDAVVNFETQMRQELTQHGSLERCLNLKIEQNVDQTSEEKRR